MATNLAHGFAAQNGGTSGGAGGRIATVSTGAELQKAINSVSSPTDRLTIFVSGTVTPQNSVADAIEIAGRNNISIIGTQGGAEFDGIGLRVSAGSSNLIIRNLKIHDVGTGPKDAIGIEGPSKNIWIDHNELYSSMTVGKDTYDGLIDIKRGAEYITISNNYLHDHHKSSLVGYSDADIGARFITYDHNLFENVGSRTPSVRFGNVHIYNNYYKDVETSGINLRMGAVGLIENNIFENVHNPIVSLDSSRPGFWDLRGNQMTGVTWGSIGSGEASAQNQKSTVSYDVPYRYGLEGAADAKKNILASAGVGAMDGSAPVTPPAAEPDPEPPEVGPAPSPVESPVPQSPATPTLGASEKSDLLTGSDGADRIDALGGHDRVSGGGGNDVISGGEGRDQLAGDDSDDAISGGNGDDVILGGNGSDLLAGDAGRDTIDGGAGSDRLFGGGSPDILRGGSGGDLLDGGAAGDSMAGNAGDDLYVVESSADVVVELVGEGFDTVQSARSFTLDAHVEKLVLTGSGDLTAVGNTGHNVLIGNAGDNVLAGGAGNDDLRGGAGSDTFIILRGAAGDDVIRDFDLEEDVLSFDGFRASDVKIEDSSTGAMIQYSGGSILLEGTHAKTVGLDWAAFS